MEFECFFLTAGDFAEESGWVGSGTGGCKVNGFEEDTFDAMGDPEGLIDVVVGGEEARGCGTTVVKPCFVGGGIGLSFVVVAVASSAVVEDVGVGEIEDDECREGQLLKYGVGLLAAGSEET